jgi:hypothetical protein
MTSTTITVDPSSPSARSQPRGSVDGAWWGVVCGSSRVLVVRRRPETASAVSSNQGKGGEQYR